MVKRITDLMDGEFTASVELAADDGLLTTRIQSAVAAQCGEMRAILPAERNGNDMKHTKKRRISISLLIAALAALLTVGTVAAVVLSQMNWRDVSGEVVSHDVIDAAGVMHHDVVWEGASLGFEFTLESEEFKEVWFRPGWLPTLSGGKDLEYADNEGWTDFRTGSYHNLDGFTFGGTPYQLQIYWGHKLVDTTWFLTGDAEIVKEETWNGLQRTDVVVHEGGDELGAVYADTNYILLFSGEDNYLIRISGYEDFETLERIAEELEIRVTDTVITEPPPAAAGLFTAQPLDMEGSRITVNLLAEIKEAGADAERLFTED